MKALMTLSMVALLAVASAGPASAQYRGGWGYGGGANINAVQAQLQLRINQGIANGRLSRQEASRLQAKLSQVANLEARMRASGSRLTPKERNKLNKQLSNLNFQITRELNDFERRRVGYWNRGWNR